MAIKNQIDALLKQEMDRKDFLKYAGTVILGIIGVTGILRMVLGSHTGSTVVDDSNSKGGGYGTSAYGK